MSICDNLNNRTLEPETSVKFVIVPNTLKVFLPEVLSYFNRINYAVPRK